MKELADPKQLAADIVVKPKAGAFNRKLTERKRESKEDLKVKMREASMEAYQDAPVVLNSHTPRAAEAKEKVQR